MIAWHGAPMPEPPAHHPHLFTRHDKASSSKICTCMHERIHWRCTHMHAISTPRRQEIINIQPEAIANASGMQASTAQPLPAAALLLPTATTEYRPVVCTTAILLHSCALSISLSYTHIHTTHILKQRNATHTLAERGISPHVAAHRVCDPARAFVRLQCGGLALAPSTGGHSRRHGCCCRCLGSSSGSSLKGGGCCAVRERLRCSSSNGQLGYWLLRWQAVAVTVRQAQGC
eukprot:18773-Pelagomonas_calceolata.AAC.1